MDEKFLVKYVVMRSSGYTCYDGSTFPTLLLSLFSEDSSHNLLFEYISHDLTALPKLFMQHVASCINLDTLELVNGQCETKTCKMIEDIVKSLHPYNKDIYTKIIIYEIGKYFNDLLLFRKNLHPAKDWYIKRITRILSPWIPCGDIYPVDFYNSYARETYQDDYSKILDFETLPLLPYVKEAPIGFNDEIRNQSLIRNLLYYILDIDADPNITSLTIPQRIWLCDHMFELEHKDFNLNIVRSASYTSPYQSFQEETVAELCDLFLPIRKLDSHDLEANAVPESRKKVLCLAIESARRVQSAEYIEKYKVDNLRQLLYLEIISMAQDGVMIRKCKNCGKYFVVHNRKNFYCDRVNKSGERCSTVGTFKNFQRKLATEEPLKIYTRAYKTHFARFKKGTISREELNEWRLEGKKKLGQVRDGSLNISDFAQWLKK